MTKLMIGRVIVGIVGRQRGEHSRRCNELLVRCGEFAIARGELVQLDIVWPYSVFEMIRQLPRALVFVEVE